MIVSKTGANGWTVLHVNNCGHVLNPQFLNPRSATQTEKQKIKWGRPEACQSLKAGHAAWVKSIASLLAYFKQRAQQEVKFNRQYAPIYLDQLLSFAEILWNCHFCSLKEKKFDNCDFHIAQHNGRGGECQVNNYSGVVCSKLVNRMEFPTQVQRRNALVLELPSNVINTLAKLEIKFPSD